LSGIEFGEILWPELQQGAARMVSRLGSSTGENPVATSFSSITDSLAYEASLPGAG